MSGAKLETEDMIECPKCKGKVDPEKKVCPNCGTWLKDVGKIHQATPHGSRARVQ